jgi:hypothetical protein
MRKLIAKKCVAYPQEYFLFIILQGVSWKLKNLKKTPSFVWEPQQDLTPEHMGFQIMFMGFQTV